MADTSQCVTWALQYSCKLRSGDAVTDPVAALRSTFDVRIYSDALAKPADERSVYGNVCVMSYRLATSKSGKTGLYPSGGFLLSEAFAGAGGTEQLFTMCGGCPANTIPARLANCTGTFGDDPDCKENDRLLQEVINEAGLREEFAAAFPQTDPLWYGLWAVSPVPDKALRILRILMSGMPEEKRNKSLATFLRAVEIAEQASIPLLVSLSPPGHTDFGWYTVFAHCPFCKAGAKLPRWKGAYPTQLHACHACGTRYSPAETATATKQDFRIAELRELMGQAAFESMAREYLITRGKSPEVAEEIVRDQEADELREKQEREKRGLYGRLRMQFLKQELLQGLVARLEPGAKEGDRSHPAFDAGEFDKLLKKCETMNVRIMHMWRYSESGTIDKSASQPFVPQEVLREWLRGGDKGLFGAVFETTDELLAAYARTNPGLTENL